MIKVLREKLAYWNSFLLSAIIAQVLVSFLNGEGRSVGSIVLETSMVFLGMFAIDCVFSIILQMRRETMIQDD